LILLPFLLKVFMVYKFHLRLTELMICYSKSKNFYFENFSDDKKTSTEIFKYVYG
jgi:hypothetical protein